MTRGRVKRLARLATGALLLLVASGFGAPRSASAGCSHPLGSQSEPLLELYRLDAIFMAGSSSDSRDEVSRSPLESPARRSPCSGLSCSSRDPLPISTASPGLESSQQWGATLCALVDLADQHLPPAGRSTSRPRSPPAKNPPSSIPLASESPTEIRQKYGSARLTIALPRLFSASGESEARSAIARLRPSRKRKPGHWVERDRATSLVCRSTFMTFGGEQLHYEIVYAGRIGSR